MEQVIKAMTFSIAKLIRWVVEGEVGSAEVDVSKTSRSPQLPPIPRSHVGCQSMGAPACRDTPVNMCLFFRPGGRCKHKDTKTDMTDRHTNTDTETDKSEKKILDPNPIPFLKLKAWLKYIYVWTQFCS